MVAEFFFFREFGSFDKKLSRLIKRSSVTKSLIMLNKLVMTKHISLTVIKIVFFIEIFILMKTTYKLQLLISLYQ